MPATFELYQDRAGEFRWRLRHSNGNIIAGSGQGYTTKADALESIDAYKESAEEPMREFAKEELATAPISDLTKEVRGVRDGVDNLVSLQKVSLRWHWRFLAIVVAIASVGALVFQILTFWTISCK